ncbi:MAG: nucleoside kinase [Eubacteriaceae bacterium]|nr:nucleoside kinase [Eubacteriaceae bacterium]
MKVKLKKSAEQDPVEIDVEKGTTLEEIYRRYADDIPFKIIVAKQDNKLEDLTHTVKKPCSIEFLDVRDQAAKLVYQHSLIMVYLKAVEEVMGRNEVEIQNSLSKGLYTEIKSKEPVTQNQIDGVYERMKEIVAADMPYKKIKVSRREGLEILEKTDLIGKIRLIEDSPDVKYLKFYSLEGFVNFFYGLMVPSTGYLYDFELRKYRRGVLLRHPHNTSPEGVPEFVDDRKLYSAFGEAKRWQTMQDIHYVTDLNEKIEKGESREIIQLSEALHQKKIVEIASDIRKNKKRLILIAGPSSSGKTTFARRLCIQLQVEGVKPLYMGTDDYFVERKDTPLNEKGEPNFENLEAVDVKLFNDQMNGLLQGKEVDLPTFDFIKGTKVFGKRLTFIESRQPIVIEGIHALNDKLTPLIKDDEKYRIYISPLTQLSIDDHNRISVTDARMLRRLVRDYKYRGHSAAETIRSWPQVRAGEDKNVFPYNGKADVFFNSSHIYELGVLKKYAEPLLVSITQDEEEYSEAVRLLKFLDFFKVIKNDELITNDSILREFIGGSIFVE